MFGRLTRRHSSFDVDFVLRSTGDFRVRWDLMIMCFAIWNAWNVPYSVSFDEDFDEMLSILVLNSLIDFLFFIDIILNFRTSFFDMESGEEILNKKEITKHYLKSGKFFIDLLSALPFDILLSICVQERLSSLKALGLLKMIRISRLNRFISYMRAREDTKLSMKLVTLTLFLLIYVHFIGCA